MTVAPGRSHDARATTSSMYEPVMTSEDEGSTRSGRTTSPPARTTVTAPSTRVHGGAGGADGGGMVAECRRHDLDVRHGVRHAAGSFGAARLDQLIARTRDQPAEHDDVRIEH